jgi:DNA polymerase III epsilon subunit-like protein
MSTRLRHVMIDIETMGTVPEMAIVSIGAVLFDPRLGKVSDDTFYVELDWDDQGRYIDPSVTEWWSRQSPLDQEGLFGLDELEGSLGALSEWLPNDCKVWSNGPTFDISCLEHAYRQNDIEIPWKFWNIRDCRTVLDMYESRRGGLNKKVSHSGHNALTDAVHQAKMISMMWAKLMGGK